MTAYVLAFLIIFAENLMPAFGPPTWLVLVYLTLVFGLEPVPLIIMAVITAAFAHWLMAHAFRKLRPRLPQSYVRNMNNLGAKIVKSSATSWGLLILFLWSPLSSAQLFVAAGLMPQIKILPLTLTFALGRCFTYSTYVYGAHKFAETDLGERILHEMTSPLAIAIQVAMVAGIIALGMIRWKDETFESHSDSENLSQ